VSVAVGAEKKNFFGISASDLSSGSSDLREDVFSNPEKLDSVDRWNYVVSAAGFIDFLSLACGFSLKPVRQFKF
jgi:hypothetical protein